MPWLDYLLIGIILISALISLMRGFVREAFSLAVWVLAIWISWNFFRELAVHFDPWITSPTVRLGVAFAILMISSLLVGGMVVYLVAQLVERTGMSGTDRFIGMIFGAARGVLLNAILVLLAGLTTFPQEAWWNESSLMPYFTEIALWLRDLLPADTAEHFRYTTLLPNGWRIV